MSEILDVPTDTVPTDAPPTDSTGWTGEIKVDGAPEVVKNLLETKKWNNVEQIATGYNELEKFTGIGKHLVIPEAEDAEGWNNVYNSLGRPETPDKYIIEDDEVVPLDAELTDKWKQYAHKMGYTQKQMAGAVQFQRDIIKGALEAEAAQQAAAAEAEAAAKEEKVQALKQKLGANYDAEIRGARVVADNLGIYKTLEAKGLASDPEIIEMLIAIKNKTAEGVITPPTPPEPAKMPQDELEELKKNEAFTKRMHPKHKEVMKRFMELNRIIANSPGYKQKSR